VTRRLDDGSAPARPEEIAAFADGRLEPARAAEIDAQAARDPELAAEIAEQRRAVAIVGGIAQEAPTGLRERVEAARRPARVRRRRTTVGGLVVAVAAVAALLAVVLPAGGGPDAAEAAALGALPASQGPPPVAPGQPALLEAALDGVVFPSWQAELGWRAAGQRADELEGRDTRTVLYDKDGRRVAYTIVSGAAIDRADDAREETVAELRLWVFREGDRLAVSWLRDGNTCVLSARGVSEGTLLRLAAWDGGGAVEF